MFVYIQLVSWLQFKDDSVSSTHQLHRPPSHCLLTQTQLPPINQLPTQSYICMLGGLLAILDLHELASQPSTNGTSLVVDIGQRLLNLVGKYVRYLCDSVIYLCFHIPVTVMFCHFHFYRMMLCKCNIYNNTFLHPYISKMLGLSQNQENLLQISC